MPRDNHIAQFCNKSALANRQSEICNLRSEISGLSEDVYHLPMHNKLKRGAVATLIAGLLGVTVHANGGRLQAVVEGQRLSPARVLSIVVDGDIVVGYAFAEVTLQDNEPSSKLPKAGGALDIDGTSDGTTVIVFKGEIVSVEPVFDVSGESHVIIRALNRLHRLTRGRQSRTYEKMSDAQVAAELALKAGLAFGPSGPEAAIGQERIFQHDETDLEFLRRRAARIGYEVFVDDKTLYFQRRREAPPISLDCAPTLAGSSAFLKVFHPRLASANVVSKVTVRGWDPNRQEDIIATATRRLIPLSPAGRDVTSPPGRPFDLGFVQPLDAAEVSYGAAIGTLTALTAGDLSGEADADGNASLRVGGFVEIQGLDQTFDGAYYVAETSHRIERGVNDGWHTLMRLVRADRAVYVLPELGDEVLVAFENGDISRPIVVGSLWNDQERPPEEAPLCGPRSRRP